METADNSKVGSCSGKGSMGQCWQASGCLLCLQQLLWGAMHAWPAPSQHRLLVRCWGQASLDNIHVCVA